MKLKASVLLLSSLFLLLLASCKRDIVWDEIATTQPTGVADVLNFTAATAAFTKVDTTGFIATDTVGVSMFGLSDSLVLAGNKKYGSVADGKLAPQTGETISYPANGTLVNFVAYYPYQPGADSIYKVSLGTQPNLNAIDLMYAAPATNFNVQSRTTPYLQFQHQLAKVELRLKKPAGLNASMKNLQVTIKEQTATADFNLKTGTFNNMVVGDIKPNIEYSVAEIVTSSPTSPKFDTTCVATFFLIPERVEGKIINVKLESGRVFELTFPVGASIAKGEKKSFELLLQPTERIIFSEGFGTLNPTGTANFNEYTGYDNGLGLVITGTGRVLAGGTGASSNGMRTNNGRFGGGQQNIKIEGINTADYQDLKLQFKASLINTAPVGGIDFNTIITVKYNNVIYPVPSTIALNSITVYDFTVDLSGVPESATGVVEIIGNMGGVPARLFRLDDVKLIGRK